MLHLLVFVYTICVITAYPVSESQRSIKSRILHGERIKIEDAPYQVAIIDLERMKMCGGSIIAPNYILTAGHCTESSPANYRIRSGTNEWKKGGKLHKVVEVIPHNGYKDNIFSRPIDDIGLLKIEPAFDFDSTRKIIELVGKDEVFGIGQDAFVTGWGMDETGNATDNLMGLVVNIVDKKKCDKGYANVGGIDKNQLCATHPTQTRDFCSGDSGGPLVINGKQVGVVSWSGPGCGKPGRPGVYTDIAKYRDWIDQHIKV